MAGHMKRLDGGIGDAAFEPWPRELGRWGALALFVLEALWFGPHD